MAWLRKWGVWLLGLAAVLLGAGWLWNRHRNALGRVRDKLEVAEATKEIAYLRAQREAVAARVSETDEAVLELDRRIVMQKERLLAAHEVDEDLSDEEVADRLREVLGG